MEETMNLGEIFGILRKRLLLILIVTLAGLALASGVTFFLITPKFSSSAELIVQSKSDGANTNLQADVNANVLLINTYKDMIMGDVVLNDVQQQLETDFHLQLNKSQLKGIVSVEQSQNSQMFQIKATTNNPDEAADIANLTAAVFKEKATDVLDVNKVTITSDAQSIPVPVSPNNKLNAVIGALLGLVIGIGLTFLIELLDKTVKDERFAIEELGLPMIGTINEMSSKELEKGRLIETVPTFIEEEDARISRRSRNRI
ncbi:MULTISPECIES: Wzz/FepE/Etk N-terminal domain-containing protein [unclassified Enterococcus]|uniref:YveK family protein n=1 Tax=unclassified Enterococcus TaxID=2608891 RepID=UPI0013ECFB2E|nr:MULTISPECIES: Wzz/FepE/Etk N-terminal domain-containing protein [unclassified Enterococcus]